MQGFLIDEQIPRSRNSSDQVIVIVIELSKVSGTCRDLSEILNKCTVQCKSSAQLYFKSQGQ
jgi:hypothetical protein